MYTAFLAVAQACGTPGMLAALALGQVSNLMGCLTTYGIGSAPPYFGAGYVAQGDWLKVTYAGSSWTACNVFPSLVLSHQPALFFLQCSSLAFYA